MAQPFRSSVTDLYEREIRSLPLQERLHLAQRIIADAAATMESENRPRSLLELEGLGADLWESVDAQEYIRELRREWDSRP